jgi:hypothetical protein
MKQLRKVTTVTQSGMSPVPLEASLQTLSGDPPTTLRELDEGSALTWVILEKGMTLRDRDGDAVVVEGVMAVVTNKYGTTEI